MDEEFDGIESNEQKEQKPVFPIHDEAFWKQYDEDQRKEEEEVDAMLADRESPDATPEDEDSEEDQNGMKAAYDGIFDSD